MKLVLSLVLALASCVCFELKNNLSEYKMYVGNPVNLLPSDQYIPYELITPLFTDYAFKHRMIYLPEGEKIKYNDSIVFDFPIGTIIVKTFYYLSDFNDINSDVDLIETRLLVHENSGWKGYPYIWNDNDLDATLTLVGGEKIAKWKNNNKQNEINYFIPNVNQCKSCHSNNGDMLPIGPSARQLNSDFTYGDEKIINQLVKWNQLGIIDIPISNDDIPKIAKWDDIESASLNDRARAWLDINCAHCHNINGTASNTGLYLDIYQTNNKNLGIFKKPVAAGRGSGGLLYDIVPGKPNESILIYRYNSTDPAVMMPELGRTLIHKEGLEIISSWIAELNIKNK